MNSALLNIAETAGMRYRNGKFEFGLVELQRFWDLATQQRSATTFCEHCALPIYHPLGSQHHHTYCVCATWPQKV